MNEKIISICIPTYNRAAILEKTLTELVKENLFLSGKVEICISDNASPDTTELVVQKFMDKYENIVYNRNKENTGVIDGNFPLVASLATGIFIKFLNDYATFIPGELDRMIEFIEANREIKPILFFPNNCLNSNNNEIIYCQSLNEFIKNASYWTTWVLAAGFWREDFLSIKERDRSIDKFMWCPDNYLRLISSGRNSIVYNIQFCQLNTLSSKGGYNFFQIFVINYLSLYEPYLKNKQLSISVFKAEKRKLYNYYLIPLTAEYLTSKTTNYSFGTSGAFKILFRKYWCFPYFYSGLFHFTFLLIASNSRINQSFLYKKLKGLKSFFISK